MKIHILDTCIFYIYYKSDRHTANYYIRIYIFLFFFLRLSAVSFQTGWPINGGVDLQMCPESWKVFQWWHFSKVNRSEGLSSWNQVFIHRRRKTAVQQHAAGLVSVRWWEEPAFLQTSELELKAKRSILLPSEQRVFFLTVWESFRSLFTCISCWGEACVCSHNSVWENASVLVDLLQRDLGFQNDGLCSEQDDFISFPRSVPSYSPLSELWWTIFWPLV